MTETVNIVGAGIGGLTTALFLKKNGIEVNLYESSSEIKPVGAGIILANNAMQVFKVLGLQTPIESLGNRISAMKITDEQLNPLSVVDLSSYEQKYGVTNIAIHRGELQKILADTIGYGNINLSKRLANIEKGENFKLTFEDNSIIESKHLIGADGIKSIVRNQLFAKSNLRNAKQICWRGICEIDLPLNYHNELNEAWGKGKRFGFVKISPTKVYWYALANANHILSDNIDLTDLFDEFHEIVKSIINATLKEKIILSDILDLEPIEKWQNKNVCLIGDAAHATTPNLGQGACQAIEDAFVLGKLLSQGFSIEKAFEEYEKLRKKKAQAIVKSSWQIGKLAHIENHYGIWLRNNIMKMMPKSANKRQMDMIFELN
ncbi:2-polyprenyl-6-methoxyphenol hydroxylase-like FAD-dependent oxidoreductase [Arcicella aurantiaca]|uniref:2-polyprenyl-6-methoxyphenol hydroxylase-like FAD-dependent oxidoreductase n=1 Tax=Arcicella aurantiaca TaxID=591202 RepID=A0A316EHD8_9BACT|nr:FAD-dependent monooxygenase [Arcicella aurantiaca]PWK22400.1 2-polyprenyl-6-methoxyphenol hydroxylase-like FAD-dependent oxidoreductase [Arcicella aurantiaca]